MPAWVIITSLGSKLVLITLFGLSVWSVSIMIERFRVLKEVANRDDSEKAKKLILQKNWRALRDWTNSNSGPLAGALKSALAVDSPMLLSWGCSERY